MVPIVNHRVAKGKVEYRIQDKQRQLDAWVELPADQKSVSTYLIGLGKQYDYLPKEKVWQRARWPSAEDSAWPLLGLEIPDGLKRLGRTYYENFRWLCNELVKKETAHQGRKLSCKEASKLLERLKPAARSVVGEKWHFVTARDLISESESHLEFYENSAASEGRGSESSNRKGTRLIEETKNNGRIGQGKFERRDQRGVIRSIKKNYHPKGNRGEEFGRHRRLRRNNDRKQKIERELRKAANKLWGPPPTARPSAVVNAEWRVTSLIASHTEKPNTRKEMASVKHKVDHNEAEVTVAEEGPADRSINESMTLKHIEPPNNTQFATTERNKSAIKIVAAVQHNAPSVAQAIINARPAVPPMAVEVYQAATGQENEWGGLSPVFIELDEALGLYASTSYEAMETTTLHTPVLKLSN